MKQVDKNFYDQFRRSCSLKCRFFHLFSHRTLAIGGRIPVGTQLVKLEASYTVILPPNHECSPISVFWKHFTEQILLDFGWIRTRIVLVGGKPTDHYSPNFQKLISDWMFPVTWQFLTNQSSCAVPTHPHRGEEVLHGRADLLMALNVTEASSKNNNKILFQKCPYDDDDDNNDRSMDGANKK